MAASDPSLIVQLVVNVPAVASFPSESMVQPILIVLVGLSVLVISKLTD